MKVRDIRVGVEIARIRQKKKLTQDDLARGGCTQAVISNIEQGKQSPSLAVLQHISDRLETPVDHFITLFKFENADYVEITINEIEKYASEHDYEAIYNMTSYELKGKASKSLTWFNVFLQWNHIFASFKIKKSDSKTALQQLISLEQKSQSADAKLEDIRSRILNSIAIIYAESNEHKESLTYFQHALTCLEYIKFPEPSRDERVYQIRIIYNMGKTRYDLGCYDEALQEIETGISLCRKHESLSLLGQLFYYKGQCYEHLNKTKEEISPYFNHAYLIFKFLKKDKYINIIHELKREYLIDG